MVESLSRPDKPPGLIRRRNRASQAGSIWMHIPAVGNGGDGGDKAREGERKIAPSSSASCVCILMRAFSKLACSSERESSRASCARIRMHAQQTRRHGCLRFRGDDLSERRACDESRVSSCNVGQQSHLPPHFILAPNGEGTPTHGSELVD